MNVGARYFFEGINIRAVECIFFAFLFSFTLFSFVPRADATPTASVPSPYWYTYNVAGFLDEVGSMAESESGYWWLNSGGKLTIKNGVGMTVQGALPSADTFRALYASSNPLDTDNGTHPQNLFRLVSRSQWSNVRVESMFNVKRDNFSASENRNGSNGLLLMSRYQMGGDTLYYAGIRVDGDAVIKKKKNGTYTTLASKQVFAGTYVEGGKVNLIPHLAWIALQSETVTNSDGSVTVRLFMKKPGQTGFTKILEAKDASSPITGNGYVGIRTDFMDVEFDTFKATTM